MADDFDELRAQLERQNTELAERNRKILRVRPLPERERLHVLVKKLWKYLPDNVFEEESGLDIAELAELVDEAVGLGIKLEP